MQYTRNDVDFRRGTFRVRGDSIDIFPAELGETALRVSLFDDEIESLTLFDRSRGSSARRCRASPCTRRATTSRRARRC